MNLIEAIKSGKPFRKPDWHQWIHHRPNTGLSDFFVKSDSGFLPLKFYREDFFRDDWEVEEETITVTRSQVEQFLKKFFITSGNVADYCRELGFKDER